MLKLLLPIALAGSVLGWFPGQDAPGLRRRDDFSFDINQGQDTQRDTASMDAPDLEFTTDGGTPFYHPYEYQRIGDDGMWLSAYALRVRAYRTRAGPLLLQDVHLTELFGAFDRERIPERVVHAKGGTFPGLLTAIVVLTAIASVPSGSARLL